MVRAAYMISVHPGRVEGIGIDGDGVQPDTAVMHTPNSDGEGPAQIEQALEGFFRAANWEPRPAVLVLNTEDVRFRKIDFPFSNAKKVRQALAFELEQVLLEPLEAMAYDFRIIPHEDGTAEALVYLVPREDLERILEVCAQHRIEPWRITFSAHALSQELGDDGTSGFLVYAGDDEIFVADVAGNELHAVKSIGGDLPDTAAATGDVGAQGADQGPTAAIPSARLQMAGEEINRFIRTHGLGKADAAVIVKGRLAPWFRWQAEAGLLTLQAPPNGHTPHAAEGLTGVLAELQAAPRNLLASRGINFSRRGGAWLGQLKEVRRVLIALAARLVLALSLGTFNLVVGLRSDRLQAIAHGEVEGPRSLAGGGAAGNAGKFAAAQTKTYAHGRFFQLPLQCPAPVAESVGDLQGISPADTGELEICTRSHLTSRQHGFLPSRRNVQEPTGGRAAVRRPHHYRFQPAQRADHHLPH